MRVVRMVQAVDAPAAGDPGRVIVGGVLAAPDPTDAFGDGSPVEDVG